MVRGPGADDQAVAGVGNAAQLVQAAHVDQQVRVGQAEPEQWHQALPAGDDLGVLTAVGQRADRVVHRRRADVLELGRDHAAPPSCGTSVSGMACGLLPWLARFCRAACCTAALACAPPPPCAVWMARHTRSGVHGIVMSLIPSGRSASTIAFTTAGVEAMVPASPTPLTPSRFEAGLSVLSVM